MDILVLEGLPRKGKTTTIGLVYDLVIANGGTSKGKVKINTDPKDFSAVMTNYKNKKIGFFSMGDNSTRLVKTIRDFNKQNCDLLICALSNATPKKRANAAINTFKNIRVNKTASASIGQHASLNNNDAQIIFNLI